LHQKAFFIFFKFHVGSLPGQLLLSSRRFHIIGMIPPLVPVISPVYCPGGVLFPGPVSISPRDFLLPDDPAFQWDVITFLLTGRLVSPLDDPVFLPWALVPVLGSRPGVIT
jgi:hypothetical protein